MPFKKGDPKPANSGRRKGVRNKKKVIRVEEYIRSNDISLPNEMFKAINKIKDPVIKFKSLLEVYRFIDTQPKDKEQEEQPQEEPKEPGSVLNIVNKK